MKKYINIKTNGAIPEMGYKRGPILVPCRVDIKKIRTMLKNGRILVELNPNNYDEKIPLTLENYDKDNFGTGEKKEFVNHSIDEISKEEAEKLAAQNASNTEEKPEQPAPQNEDQPTNEQQVPNQENKNQNTQANENKGSNKKNGNKK